MTFFTEAFTSSSALLLIFVVAVIGVLHTMVPDHWVPITVIARQRGWTKGQVARAATTAGLGHVATTLILGLIVWVGGVAVASRFGNAVDLIASLALVAFGAWVAVSAWSEQGHEHGHHHHHDHHHDDAHEHGQDHDDHAPATKSNRTALLLILGSSPMVEGIPAFFAASKFGIGTILVMSVVFGVSTILTYVVLCVSSYAGMEKLEIPAFEKYGEVLSGVIIALLGLVFLLFPVL